MLKREIKIQYLILVVFLLACNIVLATDLSTKDTAKFVNSFANRNIKLHKSNIKEITSIFKYEGYEIVNVQVSSVKNNHLPYSETGNYAFFIYQSDTLEVEKIETPHLVYYDVLTGSFYFGAYDINTKNIGSYKIGMFSKYQVKMISFEDNVYNYSLECMSFCEDGNLSKVFKDINNDNIPDILFSGYQCFYCEGLEEGFSRKDRSPVKKSIISIKYVSKKEGNSINWYKD